jgi:tetratricopeptide (TPR) repeat protein
MKIGNMEGASKDLYRAIKLDSSYVYAYNSLGVLLYNQNAMMESIKSLSKAISLKPDYQEAYANRALAYIGNKQIEKAKKDLTQCISIDSSFYMPYYIWGMINLSEGDTIAACENLSKTINKGDNRIDDFYKKICR